MRSFRIAKIGTTNGVARRLFDLQGASPIPLLLVAEIDGGHAVEAALHKRFAHLRLHGEWFLVDAEIGALIYEIQVAGRRWSADQLRGALMIDRHRNLLPDVAQKPRTVTDGAGLRRT